LLEADLRARHRLDSLSTRSELQMSKGHGRQPVGHWRSADQRYWSG